ncbi:asparaginase [Limimaricola soesokkakensis]|uniref:Asparaginase n=1 Tax=Limimaricola soesokkakensis TaxID=1343159 RepID=A0A1X6Z4N6_9RHOB|nr:asparaginase [Limimaricola soesokkakensis]PSK86852.1 asparaginase [Limimaricola soesokkakensis]SLN40639.1 L-asparaginase [Limimaricola soesokkakensis]
MTGVTLISTGGTIASRHSEKAGAVVAGLGGSALLAALHDPLDGIEVRVEEFRELNSFALTLQDAHGLVAAIRAALARPDCDGVVVTHGTDTMEESAYLADLLVAGDKPVVFTGAQRHAGDPDTDGPRNIADAIRVAADPATRGIGSAIVFEGEIHAARDVTKAHASRTDTFRSPGMGKIGEVDLREVHLYRHPGPRRVVEDAGLVEGVELLKLALGATPAFLEFCAESGAPGIVIEGFGRGNAPRGFASVVARLTAAGVPVLVASRCYEGRTRAVYGGDSGATTLVEAGALLCGTLSGLKARLLLSALLAKRASREEIATALARA